MPNISFFGDLISKIDKKFFKKAKLYKIDNLITVDYNTILFHFLLVLKSLDETFLEKFQKFNIFLY